jgi:hypothetical protein
MSESEPETGIVAKVRTEGGDVIDVIDTGKSGIRYGRFNERSGNYEFLDSRIGEVVGRQNVQYIETPDSRTSKERIFDDVYDEGKGLNPNRYSPTEEPNQKRVKTFMRNKGVRDFVKSNPLIPSSKEDEAREQVAREIMQAFDNAGSSDSRRQQVIERYDLES